MNRSQFWLALVVIGLAGLVGGALSNWLLQSQAQAGTSKLLTGTELRLLDENGRTRALLSLMRGKPRLIMTDENGEFRIEIGMAAGGEPGLWLRDQDGRARIGLTLSNSGEPNLHFMDAGGSKRAAIRLNSDGSPAFFLRDETGRDRIALWQETGELGLALADRKGRPRAGLALKEGKDPSLALYDRESRVLWFAPPGR